MKLEIILWSHPCIACFCSIYIHTNIQIGYQPVHLAAMNGHVKLVEYLVSENHGLIDAAVTVRGFVSQLHW